MKQRPGIAGFEFYGGLKSGERVGETAGGALGFVEMKQDGGSIWGDFRGRLDQRDSGFRVALRHGHDAQQMQRVWIFWFGLQHLAIEARGLVEAIGLVVGSAS